MSAADMARDAARYQYLRAASAEYAEVILVGMDEDGPNGCFYAYRGDEMDAEIDAHIEAFGDAAIAKAQL